MPIAAGTKFGPYEILSPVGAGGMGEVYRAKDTRLERTVAIKVLPHHLSDKPELKQRLEREAKSISNLSHPNICTLYDVGEREGSAFLVLEFLEGETLEQRLEKGPLPAEQVLRLAIETTDALDKAHKQGIIHRDLKPSNIMLTKSGAKLMDFGLAKLMEQPTPMAAALSELTAENRKLTAEGTILGTFQYMPPEQLEGREADARTDIFALGMVIYEAATGRPAFTGKTKASLIASILSSEPPAITTLQPLTPPALERVVKTCLAKDPDERFQTAHDLNLQLRWILEGGSQAGVAAPVAAQRLLRKRMLMAAAGIGWAVFAVAAILFFVQRGELRQARRPLAAEMSPPPGMDFVGAILGGPTISPDEKKLAFVAGDAKGNRLWIRDLGSGKTAALEGTEGAMFPFWSPDSRQVAFFAGGKLKKIEAGGGPVQILCDAPEGRGGSWSSKGAIIFTPNIYESLYRVSEGGGTPEKITNAKPGWTHRNPYFLPDGEHFLFIGREPSGTPAGDLYSGSLKGGEPKQLLEHASNAQYSGGYLLYLKDGNLVAQEFDLGSLQLKGSAIAVAEKVDYWNARDLAYFAASANGMLLYRKSTSAPNQPLWVDRNGREVGKVGEPGLYFGPSLSVDGSKLGLIRTDKDTQNGDVWLVDLKRNTTSRATFTESPNLSYVLSPDGNTLAVSSNSNVAPGLVWTQPASGSGTQEKIANVGIFVNVADWSRDGRYLIITMQENKTRWDVAYVDLKGDRKLTKFLQGPQDEQNAVLSPNGKWLAYQSDESGRSEVYVTAFPGPGGKWQISSDGGTSPAWSHDGKELYFLNNSKLMAAPIQNPESFEFGTPQALSLPTADLDGYAPGPASDRFLVLKRAGAAQSSPIQMVLNWTEALKK
jgi:Tol biopolymer transport system component/tRNA A-37 threonylcarbamoyl transferase component Bud32